MNSSFDSADALTVRSARIDDAVDLCKLLNEIIEIGGTTAFENTMDTYAFKDAFLSGNLCQNCMIATDEAGIALGFQSLKLHPKLPEGWLDIATFARVSPKVPGVGRVLFESTKKYCTLNGFSRINATIRADNAGGLAYYRKIGFETYLVTPNVPLASGRSVDRISKHYCI